MHDQGFLSRLREIGPWNFIKSIDFIAGISAFFIIYVSSGGAIPQESATALLQTTTRISASLFAIILAGLTIITSFTDKDFIYAWKQTGKFGEVMTLIEYYLYLPLIVLIFSLGLAHVTYHSVAMMLLFSLFVYTIVGMFSLVGFIIRYGLQRAEFVTQQVDERGQPTITMDDLEEIATQQGYKLVDEDKPILSEEELEQINEQLEKDSEKE